MVMDKTYIDELLNYGERVTLECKRAAGGVPKSVWETYSAFANTNGGIIILGVEEDLMAMNWDDRFHVQGVNNPEQIKKDFWNTINSDKVSTCILKDEDVQVVDYSEQVRLVVIQVPQVSYRLRPVYINGNVYKGTFKRNFEGDYHCEESEVKAMIRDANEDGNDGNIIEYHTMDDIDMTTLKNYRNEFENRNIGHTFNQLDDKEFLRQFGGYTIDRTTGKEGLTLAGLLMFGKGLSVRERFSNFRMDYIDKTNLVGDMRYSDRITYDGTWENNLYNFFRRVLTKLTVDLKRPFRLEGMQRNDDTPAHKAIREALTNSVIHADFFLSGGVLRIEKNESCICFRNPGTLKLPIAQIYEGGSSKARNPRIQNMLRMIGFGENLGSGFPTILDACKQEQWRKPDLDEKSETREVNLKLWMISMFPEEVTEYIQHLLGDCITNISKENLTVLSVAYIEDGVTNQRLQTILEKNSLEVAKILKYLTDIELLLPENKGRWTTYKLNSSFNSQIERLSNGLSNGLSNELSNRLSNRVSNGLSNSTIQLVFLMIKENPYITRKELRERIGVSDTTIQKHIKKLKFLNKIKRGGPERKGGYWIILSDDNLL